ncbi:MAG: sigma 54-interacting transcriptional regulator [Syntrophomonadaceae bacterium]
MELGRLSRETITALDTVLSGFDGALVVDKQGQVIIFTEGYASVAGIPREKVLGRNVLEFWPDSRMMEVVASGNPIYIDLWDAGSETVFVSRLPITQEGRILGAIGVCVFRYMNEAKRFANRVRRMGDELNYYKSQLSKISGAMYSLDSIIGQSEAINGAKRDVEVLGKLSSPVLIVGETGSGKELFAHAIHQSGPRYDRPFIRVNCASIPDNLVESELFGYEEGAFTGARKGGKPGKFELAHGGTILLDEINELPYHIQAKMLRVLQEGEVDRVGSTAVKYVDVRIICATNANLGELIKEKRFRQDLFYRINSFQLQVPPLRERLEDIPLLCDYFLANWADELGINKLKADDRVLQCFRRHSWPGNVRELRSVIQRACIVAGSGTIRLHHLPPELINQVEGMEASAADGLEIYMDRAEKDHILSILQSVRWNRNKAAEVLKINRTQLYRKMKKHSLLNE